jgi:hypothetical protein
MSAPSQPSLPPERMRELQMLLWLYESYHGPVCGLSIVRNHVLEQLRRPAQPR